ELIAVFTVRLKLTVCQLSMPKIAVANTPISTHTCGSVTSITLPLLLNSVSSATKTTGTSAHALVIGRANVKFHGRCADVEEQIPPANTRPRNNLESWSSISG